MKRYPEVEDLTRAIYAGMREADLADITATISTQDGLVWIGTDPAEWWTGHDTVVEVFRAQLEAIGSFDIVDGDPIGYGDGDVAWVADQPAVRLPDGTEQPLRVTGVAHCTDGGWRFVQWHVSIGVPNADAWGTELPT
ncbi:nuclear transport factor 2 family protein [Pseudonocardia sp.]|uniref:nuclear transport factor 2 family protein n=1 Tax=Pseudonocardia sp. TaxID=60912 RepID=UPI003D0E9F23